MTRGDLTKCILSVFVVVIVFYVVKGKSKRIVAVVLRGNCIDRETVETFPKVVSMKNY